VSAAVATDVIIRRVDAASHAHDLYALQEACLPVDAPADVSYGDWWLAYDDDEPVAFAGTYPSTKYPGGVYFVRAGVMQGHRGRGLHKRLIRTRLQYAKRRGLILAVTDTRDNPQSSNALIACGFRLFSPAKPWGHPDAVYWRRNL